MKIFRNIKNYQYPDKKVLGVYLPIDTIEFISLYSLATNTSKSTAVGKILKVFIDSSIINGYGKIVLINNLVSIIEKKWDSHNKNISFKSFLNKVEIELSEKIISNETIDLIIYKLKDKYKGQGKS